MRLPEIGLKYSVDHASTYVVIHSITVSPSSNHYIAKLTLHFKSNDALVETLSTYALTDAFLQTVKPYERTHE